MAAALSLLGLGLAQTAVAANHTLHMTGPVRLTQGEAALIQIEGVVAPPAEFWDTAWVEVVAIPAAVSPLCPADASSAGSVAEQSGTILAIALRPSVDEAGNFANSVAIKGGSVGPVMVCGYLYNEEGTTLYAEGMRIEVVPAAGGGGEPRTPVSGGGPSGGNPGGGAKPVNLQKPWVSRSGDRVVCHRGAWSNARTYLFNWYVDDSLRRTTNQRPYAPLPAYLGHRFSCKVTAYGPGGSASAMSPTVRLR
ncbi:MAG TPA: hypothetical protein VHA54_06940 [Solirubrobacterales bacterium]|nr:hypothetical protein [Solirubrobacterales bacterium]